MRNLFFILSICTFNSTIVGQTIMSSGQWQGIIEYEDEDVPFEFFVDTEGGITIINGEEKILIKDITMEDDSIVIPLKPFDAWIKAKINSHQLIGYWKKGYRTRGVPFRATYGVPRFKRSIKKGSKNLIGKWQIELSSPSRIPYPSVLIVNNGQKNFTGSFLTEVGDFRFFEGVATGDSILMSSFDGAHAFLFKGMVAGDSLYGELQFDNTYVENVKGIKDPSASIPVPFREVEKGHRPYFDILSAGDANVKIDTDKYFDKVLILQLFGTWCPNSMDQSNFLSTWYKTKPSNVEVLAVTFEPNFSTAYGNKRINSYRNDMNLVYDIALGGKLSKRQAALSLPYTDEINAFPTLVLIDKEGFVRYEFSYFNGPATGIYHQQFKDKFAACIAELVEE